MNYKNFIKNRHYILLIVINLFIYIILLINGTSLSKDSFKMIKGFPVLIFLLETQDSKYIKIVSYFGFYISIFINLFLLVTVIIIS